MMAYLTREARNPTPRVDMKLQETGREMSLLSEFEDKVPRKRKALPPKTNRVKMSRGQLGKPKKVMFNYATNKFENMEPDEPADVYTMEKRLNAEALTFDPDLGKFVNKRTGKTGSLSDFKEELGEFEKMFDNKLKRDKKNAKKIVAKKNGEDKPKPNINVVPFPYEDANEKPWYESYLREIEKPVKSDPINDMSVDDYMRMKQQEYEKKLMAEALKKGIGQLL